MDESSGLFSSISPKVAKAAITVSFGGKGAKFSVYFKPMMEEKTSRLKDNGLLKLERVKVIVFVALYLSRIPESEGILDSSKAMLLLKAM
ncbi:hypothetical protein Tco_0821382 [Tanacetum coccineum]|uniref:Chalcone-flavonone isomerase family protein n=1 Tax=Tanacetum coccineum TaxID=301880 RepID=A0ABQ5AGE3_9ASTR